jgi:hypothetical protein
MIRRTPLIIALSLALVSALSASLPAVQAAARDGRGDLMQAPRWGDITGEGSIQSPRGNGPREPSHQAPRA